MQDTEVSGMRDPTPKAFTESDIHDWALAAGMPEPIAEMPGWLVDFAHTVVEKCAAIGDRYDDGDRNGGEEIRAMFGLG
jgi:hypothetical protein